MRHIVFLTGDYIALQVDVAVVHHKWRDAWPLIKACHQSFAQGSRRNVCVIPHHHEVQVRVFGVARDQRAQQIDQGESAKRLICGQKPLSQGGTMGLQTS